MLIHASIFLCLLLIACNAKKYAYQNGLPATDDKCFSPDIQRIGYDPNWQGQAPYFSGQPPAEILFGMPLQMMGDVIKIEMDWDTNTGEPYKKKSQCARFDQTPKPPAFCVKIVDSTNPQSALLCEGARAEFSVIGTRTISLFKPSEAHDIKGNTYISSATAWDNQNICCSDEIVPVFDNGFTKVWVLPVFKIYVDGTFQIHVTNTDLLLANSAVKWAVSNTVKIYKSLSLYVTV